MSYRELSLQGLSSECVEALWFFNPKRKDVHRVLPDGRMDLLARFEVGDRGTISKVRLVIAGPAQRPSYLPTRADTGLLGIRFRVGWGGVCLGVDPARIRDDVLLSDDAHRVLGALAHPILQSRSCVELRSAMTNAVNILTCSVTKTSQQRNVITAITSLHQARGCLSFESLVGRSPMSERTLRRGMLEAVGLAPKTLAAIIRFQCTLGLMRQRPSAPLTQIALEGGYSDQAHMTRAFRRLGGFTPADRPELAAIHLAML